jgi:hypothetical protein
VLIQTIGTILTEYQNVAKPISQNIFVQNTICRKCAISSWHSSSRVCLAKSVSSFSNFDLSNLVSSENIIYIYISIIFSTLVCVPLFLIVLRSFYRPNKHTFLRAPKYRLVYWHWVIQIIISQHFFDFTRIFLCPIMWYGIIHMM